MTTEADMDAHAAEIAANPDGAIEAIAELERENAALRAERDEAFEAAEMSMLWGEDWESEYRATYDEAAALRAERDALRKEWAEAQTQVDSTEDALNHWLRHSNAGARSAGWHALRELYDLPELPETGYADPIATARRERDALQRAVTLLNMAIDQGDEDAERIALIELRELAS